MLKLPTPNLYLKYEELVIRFNGPSVETQKEFLFRWFTNSSKPTKCKMPISSSIFLSEVQEDISMVLVLLGYDDDFEVDEAILSLMSHRFLNDKSLVQKILMLHSLWLIHYMNNCHISRLVKFLDISPY